MYVEQNSQISCLDKHIGLDVFAKNFIVKL